MATMSADSILAQIGESAGVVWHTLHQQGPLSLAKLVKATELPRDTVAMAVGWLAREDKIVMEDTPRGRVIALR